MMRGGKPRNAFLLATLSRLLMSSVAAQDFSASGIFNSSHWGIDQGGGWVSTQQMDKMVELGVTWFRTDFYHPADTLSRDQVVADAKARGIQLFATVHPPTPGEIPPKDSTEWKRLEDFVSLLVSRYKDYIKYWGIGNNLEPGKGGWTSALIGEFVKRTHAIARRIDPESKIVGPELDPGGQQAQFLAQYLDSLAQYIDAVDLHIYWDRPPFAQEVLRQLDEVIRPVLLAHGAADKPFWLTETGVGTDRVTEEVQANFYTEMCDGVAARPWIKKIFFYELTDTPSEYMGILHPDLSPKPAFFAYQAAIAAYKKPLVVASTNPANGSQNVPLNAQVQIQFSRGVNRAKVESTFVVIPSVPQSGIEWEVNKMILIPQAALSPSTVYQITIPGVALSVIGDSLDGNGNGVAEGSPADDFILSFTTGTTGSLPHVASSLPKQGATGVLLVSEIRLSFGSYMDNSSVESAFSISPSVGAGYFSWEKKTVTFRPFGFFRPGTFGACNNTSAYSISIGGEMTRTNSPSSQRCRIFAGAPLRLMRAARKTLVSITAFIAKPPCDAVWIPAPSGLFVQP
jgi:hypothetical protein